MLKLAMQGKIYKVTKKDTLTPSDEHKLVDLSHGELLYITKPYDVSASNWLEDEMNEEYIFLSSLPEEFKDEFDIIHTLESLFIEE